MTDTASAKLNRRMARGPRVELPKRVTAKRASSAMSPSKLDQLERCSGESAAQASRYLASRSRGARVRI